MARCLGMRVAVRPYLMAVSGIREMVFGFGSGSGSVNIPRVDMKA